MHFPYWVLSCVSGREFNSLRKKIKKLDFLVWLSAPFSVLRTITQLTKTFIHKI